MNRCGKVGRAVADKSRVLFLAQTPPPIHGASMVSARVVTVLRSEASVDCVHLWMGGATGLGDIGQKSLGKLLRFAAFVAILVGQILRGERYQIAYVTLAPWSHAAIRDGILIWLAKQLSERVLVHLHAEGLDEVMAGRGLLRRILKTLIRDVEMIAITVETAEDLATSRHFKAVHVLPNCVDDPGPVARAEGDRLRIGYLANLDPRKGVLRFLDGIAAMAVQGVPVEARIAGPSTSALTIAQLTDEVRARGLEAIVTICGPLYGAQKAAFFADLDVFLYLSRRDYFPLVVIEALAAGVVPIVFDNEGERELVGPEFAAHVIDPDLAPADIAARVTALAARYAQDRALLEAHSRTARRAYLERFTPAAFERRLRGIFALPPGSSP